MIKRDGYTPPVPERVTDLVQSTSVRALTISAFASGLAALVLELQWGRQLALTFGGSSNAVAAVLFAFMLGLGLGSLLGGRVADRMRAPARCIVIIEIALAVVGPLLGLALMRLPSVAASILPDITSATHPLFTLSRFVLASALLLIPTTAMGRTKP